MTRQTSSSFLLIAAIAGGIGFVAFVALMIVGEFTVSPAAFLAILVALAAAIFLFQGFHRAAPTDRPELKTLDKSKLGDVTRKAGSAGVEPGSAGVASGAASGHAAAPSTASKAGTGGDRGADAAAASGSTASSDDTSAGAVSAAPASPEPAAANDDPAAARAADDQAPAAPVAAAPPPPEDAGPSPDAGTAERDGKQKWKSSQLAGSEDLAGRKGSWKYERDDAAPAAAATAPDPNVGQEPVRLEAPRGGAPDDLKRISGVGPKLEELLHRLGIFHFDQVAAWSSDEIAWVDEHLEVFNGRVRRDEWVRQARDLASPGQT